MTKAICLKSHCKRVDISYPTKINFYVCIHISIIAMAYCNFQKLVKLYFFLFGNLLEFWRLLISWLSWAANQKPAKLKKNHQKYDSMSFFNNASPLVTYRLKNISDFWVSETSRKIGWRQVEHGFSSFFYKLFGIFDDFSRFCIAFKEKSLIQLASNTFLVWFQAPKISLINYNLLVANKKSTNNTCPNVCNNSTWVWQTTVNWPRNGMYRVRHVTSTAIIKA